VDASLGTAVDVADAVQLPQHEVAVADRELVAVECPWRRTRCSVALVVEGAAVAGAAESRLLPRLRRGDRAACGWWTRAGRTRPSGCVGQPTCVQRLDMIVKLGTLPSRPLLRDVCRSPRHFPAAGSVRKVVMTNAHLGERRASAEIAHRAAGAPRGWQDREPGGRQGDRGPPRNPPRPIVARLRKRSRDTRSVSGHRRSSCCLAGAGSGTLGGVVCGAGSDCAARGSRRPQRSSASGVITVGFDGREPTRSPRDADARPKARRSSSPGAGRSARPRSLIDTSLHCGEVEWRGSTLPVADEKGRRSLEAAGCLDEAVVGCGRFSRRRRTKSDPFAVRPWSRPLPGRSRPASSIGWVMPVNR
jgi:hypothetical protein